MPNRPVNAITRVVLWFAALLLSALLFSALPGRGLPNLFIMRITLIFALPAWLLYLPLVVAYSNATGRELRNLLIVGFLIGPASLAALAAINLLRGMSFQSVWNGDPLTGGMAGMMSCAVIVGSLTTIFYVIALRFLQRLGV
jgi:hypothetical protein